MTLQDDQERASIVLAELEQAREAWATFTEQWESVVSALVPLAPFTGRQIEAYQPFTRDQGMGDGPEAWFDRVANALQDILDTEEEDER